MYGTVYRVTLLAVTIVSMQLNGVLNGSILVFSPVLLVILCIIVFSLGLVTGLLLMHFSPFSPFPFMLFIFITIL